MSLRAGSGPEVLILILTFQMLRACHLRIVHGRTTQA